jgi:hypothetical protein
MRLMLSIKAKMTFMRNMSTYSRILRKAGWKKNGITLVSGVRSVGKRFSSQ